MVLDDTRMNVREIAETIGISKERVGYILHEELDMKNLCAGWVPRLLTADQKRTLIKIVGLWPLAYRDCGFESRRGHGCLL